MPIYSTFIWYAGSIPPSKSKNFSRAAARFLPKGYAARLSACAYSPPNGMVHRLQQQREETACLRRSIRAAPP